MPETPLSPKEMPPTPVQNSDVLLSSIFTKYHAGGPQNPSMCDKRTQCFASCAFLTHKNSAGLDSCTGLNMVRNNLIFIRKHTPIKFIWHNNTGGRTYSSNHCQWRPSTGKAAAQLHGKCCCRRRFLDSSSPFQCSTTHFGYTTVTDNIKRQPNI